jgi:predicted nucleic acid-binding protein
LKVLLDTSVLVAGTLRLHADYQRARPWLLKASKGEVQAIIAAHALAEAYAVLTRLPRPLRASPAVAWQLIERNVLNSTEIIALTSADYRDLIEHLAQTGIAGGATYDAVIACVAAQAQVDHIVTFNVRDFRRVYPALAASIIVP